MVAAAVAPWMAATPVMAKSAFEDVMPIIGLPIYSRPEKGLPTSAVVLFSGEQGWGEQEKAMASRLVAQGSLVIGVDTPAALRRMTEQTDSCVEIVGEIENVSHNTQYELDTPSYHFPVVSGIGLGGAMAMAVASQTETATIDSFVVVDPLTALPSSKPLCALGPQQPQPRPTADGQGMTYALPGGDKPFSLDIGLTTAATAETHTLAADWVKSSPGDVVSHNSSHTPQETLVSMVRSELAAAESSHNTSGDDVSDLPLEELPVSTPSDTIAIFYSGDGGWRDLDKDLSGYLQAAGLPVVGVDVLRYFWTEQTPQQSAKDLARIIRSYKSKWKAKKVLLIGFSFGADLLPILYNQLPHRERASVTQITLLGLSKAATFEVSMESWLNHKSESAPLTLPQVARINPRLIQCFYGEEDKLNVCPQLESTGVEVIHTTGGHHFDEKYDQLAQKVLAGLKQRSSKP